MSFLRVEKIVGCLAVGFLAATLLRADVRVQEKSQVQFSGMLGKMMGFFGGKAAKEGVTSTVLVKGDRKLTSSDYGTQIIDLAEEKIYDLDLKKKTYKVTTFDELRRQMQEAREKAEKEARKMQEAEKDRAEKGTEGEPEREMEVEFDLKETGQTQTINGYDTREVVMTVTIREKGKSLEEAGGTVLNSNLWMSDAVPSAQEVQDFDRRYFEQLYGSSFAAAGEQMAAALAMYPMLKDAMARMETEKVSMEGTAVRTIVAFDVVKSQTQIEQEKQQASDEESGSVGGLLGGFARKLGKKKEEPEGAPQDPSRARIMTMTNEILQVSPSVSDAEVAIPAGFKEKK